MFCDLFYFITGSGREKRKQKIWELENPQFQLKSGQLLGGVYKKDLHSTNFLIHFLLLHFIEPERIKMDTH